MSGISRLTSGPIECPPGPLRRQLTPLPAGWQSTPCVQALSSTKVNAAAKVLLCFYGPEVFSPLSAQVRVCTARAGGFDCTLPKGR